VVLNYLRALTIKIGVDEPGSPRQLDCLPIIDPQQQEECQTRPCWPGSGSSRTSSTSRSHANSPSDGPPTKFTPQIEQVVIELTLQHPNVADLQIAQTISETSEILANCHPRDLRSHLIILRLACKSGAIFRRLFVTPRKSGFNKL
jgi:hypothetical protein